MIIRSAKQSDSSDIVNLLTSAFSGDPLIEFLFGKEWEHQPHVGEFFRILLDVRVALKKPAICAEENGVILGAAMGYDVERPSWSESQVEEWKSLLSAVQGLESRLGEYGRLADRFEPAKPHFYLGVIGVLAGTQGQGVGRKLLEAFCDASDTSRESSGVYLETASEASLAFYLKYGFELQGEGTLGSSTKLWCVFRTTRRSSAA